MREVQVDHQMSMTIAQQKVKIKHTGSHLKRIQGALLLCVSPRVCSKVMRKG